MLHSSGHAVVDVDHLAEQRRCDLNGINTESKYYWPYEDDLFHAGYDGTLRVVGEAKGCGGTWDWRGDRGDSEKRRKEDRCFILEFGDEEVADGRETVAVNLNQLFCLWEILSLKAKEPI